LVNEPLTRVGCKSENRYQEGYFPVIFHAVIATRSKASPDSFPGIFAGAYRQIFRSADFDKPESAEIGQFHTRLSKVSRLKAPARNGSGTNQGTTPAELPG
jgi:hypothetical protein